jgi:hypothetical protein
MLQSLEKSTARSEDEALGPDSFRDHLLHARTPLAWQPTQSGFDARRVAADFANRKEIALRWRAAAQSLAARTGVPAAVETARHLETDAWLGLPVNIPLAGPFVLRGGPEGDHSPSMEEFRQWVSDTLAKRDLRYQQGLCLVPFVDMDRPLMNITKSLRPLANNPGASCYVGGMDMSSGRPLQGIFLPELSGVRPLSEVGRAISLLYQARYAMRRLSPEEPSRQSTLYWEHEADLTRLQADLMAAVAPEAYRTVLHTYLDPLRREGELLAHPERLMGRRTRRALSEIFGDISRDEAHLWGTHAYLDAIRTYLGDERFVWYLRGETPTAGPAAPGPAEAPSADAPSAEAAETVACYAELGVPPELLADGHVQALIFAAAITVLTDGVIELRHEPLPRGALRRAFGERQYATGDFGRRLRERSAGGPPGAALDRLQRAWGEALAHLLMTPQARGLTANGKPRTRIHDDSVNFGEVWGHRLDAPVRHVIEIDPGVPGMFAVQDVIAAANGSTAPDPDGRTYWAVSRSAFCGAFLSAYPLAYTSALDVPALGEELARREVVRSLDGDRAVLLARLAEQLSGDGLAYGPRDLVIWTDPRILDTDPVTARSLVDSAYALLRTGGGFLFAAPLSYPDGRLGPTDLLSMVTEVFQIRRDGELKQNVHLDLATGLSSMIAVKR